MKRAALSNPLMARLSALAITILSLVALNGVLSTATTAQEPNREIDLRDKLKKKKFNDGRRVEIETLATGEKIVAEIKNGDFVKWFLIESDGTETEAVVKKKKTYTAQTSTCTATITKTTTRTTLLGRTKTSTETTVVQIPCPGVLEDHGFTPSGN